MAAKIQIGQERQGLGPTAGTAGSAAGKKDSSASLSTAKNLGFNTPLADSTKEGLAVDIVDLLDKLRVERLEKSAITAKQREHNLKTARLLLDNDSKPYGEITGMLRWAYDDVHWSTRISTLYQLRQNYTELLHESQKRRPNRFKPRTEPHGSKFKAVKNNADEFHFLGFATSDVLNGPKIDFEAEREADRKMENDPIFQEILAQKMAERPNSEAHDGSLLWRLARSAYQEKTGQKKPSGARVLDF